MLLFTRLYGCYYKDFLAAAQLLLSFNWMIFIIFDTIELHNLHSVKGLVVGANESGDVQDHGRFHISEAHHTGEVTKSLKQWKSLCLPFTKSLPPGR